ncbi:MAG: orotate phosphoribosyltransferase [Proteobacteria bacterium]|nr:orotate phosphoribosyltransferase [Pseudomonadota bacterium]
MPTEAVSLKPEEARARLCALIAAKSLTKEGTFQLASGQTSGFYFDMKPVLLDPEGARLIAEAVLAEIEGDEVDHIGGLAMGAIPIVAAVVAMSWSRRPIAGFFVRPRQKERGTKRLVEGNIQRNARVVLVEDVTTTGGSALQAAEAVWEFGCDVVKVITVVDRLAGAGANLEARGLELTALFTRDDFKL